MKFEELRQILTDIERSERLRIQCLKASESLRTRVYRSPSTGERVKSSASNSFVESITEAILTNEEKAQKIENFIKQCRELLLSYLPRLPDAFQFEIMLRRYINGEAVADIAKSMSVSVRNLYKQYCAAERYIAPLIPEEEVNSIKKSCKP